MSAIRLLASALAVAALASTAAAQVPSSKPTLTTEAVALGGDRARLTLKVTLPEDVHVQSDRPREPSLIPTALTLSAPPGVTVTRVTYPPTSDLPQPGRPTPLAVFSGTFEIVVDVSMTGSGAVAIPGVLRYQACTERVCFAPTKVNVEFSGLRSGVN